MPLSPITQTEQPIPFGENDGNGVFSNLGLALGTEYSHGVALGDLDGDSDLDVFVANHGAFGQSGRPNQVWFNEDDNPPPTATPTPTPTPLIPTPIPSGQVAWQSDLVATNIDVPLVSMNLSHAMATNADGHIAVAYLNDRLIHIAVWNGLNWEHDNHRLEPRLLFQSIKIVDIVALQDGTFDILMKAGFLNERNYGFFHWDGTELQSTVVEDKQHARETKYTATAKNGLTRHVLKIANETLFHSTLEPGNSVLTNTTTINPPIVDVYDAQIAADSQDNIHVVYEGQENKLYYAQLNGDQWSIQELPNTQKHLSIRLVLDNNDNPIISFWDSDNNGFYAVLFDGTAWQTIQITTPANNQYRHEIGVDSADNLHFVGLNTDGRDAELHVSWQQNGAWQQETIDTTAAVGEISPLLGVDANDEIWVSWRDADRNSMWMSRRSLNWNFTTVANSADTALPSIQTFHSDQPIYLTYQDGTTNAIRFANWQGTWEQEPVAPIGNSFAHSSLRLDSFGAPRLSYYNSTTQDLQYATHNGDNWIIETVDSIGNVGKHNTLMPGTLNKTIVYWDNTNNRVKLAQKSNGGWQHWSNTLAPTLDQASGNPSGSWASDNRFYATYYDAANGTLRLATWDGAWTNDEIVAGESADVGRLSSLETVTYTGQPAVAYVNDDEDAIWYAYRDGEGWHHIPVAESLGRITSLHLELGLGAAQFPRIAFTTSNDTLFHAALIDNQWQLEEVQGATPPFVGDVSLSVFGRTATQRPYIAFADNSNGLQVAYRTAAFVDLPAYNPLNPGQDVDDDNDHDNMTPFEWCEPEEESEDRSSHTSPIPFGDFAIFAKLTPLFDSTDEGHQLATLYREHSAEMGQIALADPKLLFDSFQTLQSFMPGLEAFVTGEGATLSITPKMADDALDIWQRIEAVASPELAAVIDNELQKSNNLQDFIGLSFDEWAISIGINPPANQLFLPMITK